MTNKELEQVFIAYLLIWESDSTPLGRKTAEGLRKIYNKYTDGAIIPPNPRAKDDDGGY